jgi:hypothetical protein
MKQTKQNNARDETYYNGASTFVSGSDNGDADARQLPESKEAADYIYLKNKTMSRLRIESLPLKTLKIRTFTLKMF